MKQKIFYKTIYEQFIEHLKNEEKKLDLNDKNLEKHHILPLHDGGQKNEPVVLCSSKNHTYAHYYRYLSYGQRGDFVAFTMRWNQKIGVRQRSQLAVEKNKQRKNLFWNSEWQSIQGQKSSEKAKKNKELFYSKKWQTHYAKKGGSIGGSRNTLIQKKARISVGKKIGLKYGVQNGLKRQSFNLKKILSKTTIWVYQSEQCYFTIKVPPQTSVSSLVDLLQVYTPVTIRKGSFYKVVHGTRPQMWSLFFIEL